MVEFVDEVAWNKDFTKYPGLLIAVFYSEWVKDCDIVNQFIEKLAYNQPWIKFVKINTNSSIQK
ncbi:hypothetical protein MXB_280 [Myxobolus squamalis]|nr:hypothetical protein MXB_280 [Myxobolus squamalis]